MKSHQFLQTATKSLFPILPSTINIARGRSISDEKWKNIISEMHIYELMYWYTPYLIRLTMSEWAYLRSNISRYLDPESFVNDSTLSCEEVSFQLHDVIWREDCLIRKDNKFIVRIKIVVRHLESSYLNFSCF